MTRGRARQILARMALAGVLAIAAFEWGLLLLRPESGPLAVLQVLAPHLVLVGLVLVAVSLLDLRATSAAMAAGLALVVILRFGSEWVSVGAPSAAAGRWTWRPSRLEFLGIGLVRIDHVVVSPDIAPLSIGGVCPPAGDHCLVSARIAIPGG